YIRQVDFDANKRARIDAFRIRQYRTLVAVDRSLDQIPDALSTAGRLQNTRIAFLSDNGILWGEHRWTSTSCPTRNRSAFPSSCATTRSRSSGGASITIWS